MAASWMFYTVFSPNLAPRMQWQSDLLELIHGGGSGKKELLVRLVATDDPGKLPQQKYAECVATRCWDSHPDTGDAYPIYNKPASLLEWLFRDRPEGTVLLHRSGLHIPRAAKSARGARISSWHRTGLTSPCASRAAGYPFGLPAGVLHFSMIIARGSI